VFATVFLAAAAWSRSNERFCEPSSSEVPDRSVDHVRTATEGPPCGLPAWSPDRNQNARPIARPPPRGLPTWSDAQIRRAIIRSSSDGGKPRRDEERFAGCDCRPTGTSPVETYGRMAANYDQDASIGARRSYRCQAVVAIVV
jgi:hypothetical protein